MEPRLEDLRVELGGRVVLELAVEQIGSLERFDVEQRADWIKFAWDPIAVRIGRDEETRVGVFPYSTVTT